MQLTKGMHPLRGKGPLLLRLLNELLRRLPKSKQEDVIFAGRILMFLSGVFPLGEKSGVNLRGNFNHGKVVAFEEEEEVKDEKMLVDEAEVEGEKKEGEEEDRTATTDPLTTFYPVFWSLQRVFVNPPALFAPKKSDGQDPFDKLKNGLEKTLEVFAEQTKMEKEVSGAAVKEGVKQKDKVAVEGDGSLEFLEHHFFPKFLTSKDLLKLEVS